MLGRNRLHLAWFCPLADRRSLYYGGKKLQAIDRDPVPPTVSLASKRCLSEVLSVFATLVIGVRSNYSSIVVESYMQYNWRYGKCR